MLLDTERNINEFKEKLNELKKFASDSKIDILSDLSELESKIVNMEKQLYDNLTAWEKVCIARHQGRPVTLDYINAIFTDFVELHGDRLYADDPSIIGGVAKLGDISVTVIGHQKGRNMNENIIRNFGMPHPEGNRKALRLMKQAEKFNRPIICFIDTPGAYCGTGAEERGQGEAIARNIMTMSGIKVPVISIVIGEGGSGGALALGVADQVWMLENSVYSILSPEGFASILWKDSSRCKEAADDMRMTAVDLQKLGIIEDIIDEPVGGAHKDPSMVADELKKKLLKIIPELSKKPIADLVNARYNRFRKIGSQVDY